MDIVELISNVGFPIACVIAMGYYVKDLTREHKEEVEQLRGAIENNTLIITKLYERLVQDLNGEE